MGMTEKRFQWYRDTVALNLKMPIMDNGKKLNIGEVFNELNKLNDENEQLKKENLQLNEDLDYYTTKAGSCEEGLFQQDREISKLQKENEELKQRLEDKEIEWVRDNTVWEQMPTNKTTTIISTDFNQSNCITVQKSKIKDLEKENLQLNEDLAYYKTKSEYCEEGLFQQVREIFKLEKENEELREQVKCLLEDLQSTNQINKEIVDDVREELLKENEQLKQFIKSLASSDGRIWLANGYGYRIDKILDGDV